MKHQKQNSGNERPERSATAVAHANIALIKYWGKRSLSRNLPAVGSISMTVDSLKTETEVSFEDTLEQDHFELNGKKVKGPARERVSSFLDLIRPTERETYAEVVSTNNFPTGAGLASSASGFAALTLAASRAAGQHLKKKDLSRVARQGSGSAARSVYGGLVEMKRGATPDGKGDYAETLADEDYWDLRLVVVLTAEDGKEVGSTQGMIHAAETSPFYSKWIDEQPADLEAMRQAIVQKNFEKLGELTERSCFKMHGLMMAAQPSLLYWNPTTVMVVQKVRELRSQGIPAYITMDAGPQVKILCLPAWIDNIKQALSTINSIKKLWICKPGPAAEIISREKEKA